MRIYHFGNFYMSSIQQGIQAAHAQMEIFVKYPLIDLNGIIANGDRPGAKLIREASKADFLYSWAVYYKTMICLNAGMDIDLKGILELMNDEDNPYPWSCFYEAEEAMNGMLTNIAIVLPERIYETASNVRKREWSIVNNTVYSEPVFNNSVPREARIDTITPFEFDL